MDAVQSFFGWTWPGVWTLAKIVAIAVPLIISVAYLTLAERKVIGWIQVRIGPNRVGPLGLLQPFADVFKLIFKEIIVPTGASRYLFFIAPILSIGPALAAWAVIPFADGMVLSNINAGLLYVLALTSMGVYGVILAGWASNSKYAFLGALRSAAQIVSYEIAMGFALVGVLMVASSLNLSEIVRGQEGGAAYWYIWPLLPLFVVYLVAGIAETNRHPFDVDPLYRRFLDALRQLRPDVRHRIPNVIHRTIGRRLQLKLDRRDGHPIRDARRYVLDPDDPGRRILDVLRDLRFQLARRSTCLDDGDGDDGDVDVGHLRDRQGLQADRAEHDQDDKEHQRRNGPGHPL